MNSTATILSGPPTEICGWAITRVLTEEQTYLAIGPGGRSVVLKKIDPDCLIDGALHPVVRDRLGRVRELAHASVANLFGVERDGDDAFLMWEYVEGLRLDFYTGANHTPREVASVLRETLLAVDLLHMQGIVHGALIGSNVVVTFGGSVRLTHISPLVYTDPKVDIECVWNLLDHAAEQLGERGSMLLALAGEARRRNLPLRQLATRLSPLIDSRDAKKAVETEQKPEPSPRRRMLISAALVAALGLALAWGAWWAIGSGRFSFSDGFHHPFRTQPDR